MPDSLVSKTALVSYITFPFSLTSNDPRSSQFSNIGIARSIVLALNSLGYVVDVVNYTDSSFRIKKNYDLVIFHGGENSKEILMQLNNNPLKVYFSTGTYWQYSNQRILERSKNLENRRNFRLIPDRWNTPKEEISLRNSDGIICLGSMNILKSYSSFQNIYCINNASYEDNYFNFVKKDFEKGKKHFLFFSGGGNLHKGLDLLLESFSHLPFDLHICQYIEDDFRKVFSREFELPNIHYYGYIPNRGKIFYQLMERCNFIIFPSCSEGQPGSVVECMNQGVIPIISPDSNIDTLDFGITEKMESPDDISSLVTLVNSYPVKRLEAMSKNARQVMATEYSAAKFVENFASAVQSIQTHKKEKEPTNGKN